MCKPRNYQQSNHHKACKPLNIGANIFKNEFFFLLSSSKSDFFPCFCKIPLPLSWYQIFSYYYLLPSDIVPLVPLCKCSSTHLTLVAKGGVVALLFHNFSCSHHQLDPPLPMFAAAERWPPNIFKQTSFYIQTNMFFRTLALILIIFHQKYIWHKNNSIDSATLCSITYAVLKQQIFEKLSKSKCVIPLSGIKIWD